MTQAQWFHADWGPSQPAWDVSILVQLAVNLPWSWASPFSKNMPLWSLWLPLPKTEAEPPKTICLSPGSFQHTWSSRGEGRGRLLEPWRPLLCSRWCWCGAAPETCLLRCWASGVRPTGTHLGSLAAMSITKAELSLARTGPTFAIPPNTMTLVPSSCRTTREWPILAGGLKPLPVSTFLQRRRVPASASPSWCWVVLIAATLVVAAVLSNWS
mmetsp:Transcript_10940/g.30751  ORF Transcript_10940/g.30751 Transcript_10940/m.30751 type:complete len:213 (-) Transcript_10940:2254-2892(-)